MPWLCFRHDMESASEFSLEGEKTKVKALSSRRNELLAVFVLHT